MGETCINERRKRRIDVLNYMYNVLNNINNVLLVNILYRFYVYVYITDVLSKASNIFGYNCNVCPSFFSLSIKPSLIRPTL